MATAAVGAFHEGYSVLNLLVVAGDGVEGACELHGVAWVGLGGAFLSHIFRPASVRGTGGEEQKAEA